MSKSLSSAIHISLDDPKLWSKIVAASSDKKVGFFRASLSSGGPLYILSMNQGVSMEPFLRSQGELFMESSVNAYKDSRYDIIINGPTYSLTNAGKVDALMGSDPVDIDDVIQQGRIVRKKKVIAGQTSNMYFIANYKDRDIKYVFGKGFAPTDADSAIGNAGPLIINNLKFGDFNVYNPEQDAAPEKGEPAIKFQKYLVQRSNSRFSSMLGLPDPVGKIAIGFNKKNRTLCIIIQPNGSSGINIFGFRTIMSNLNLDSAIYLDGSDSVSLILDGKVLIEPGSNKNETNITGIGFRYE